MTEHSVASQATDRVAGIVSLFYGAFVLLWAIRGVGHILQHDWIWAGLAIAIVAVFGIQGWGWAGATRATVEITDSEIRRTGVGLVREFILMSWHIPRDALRGAEIRSVRGRPYLFVVAEPRPRGGRLSALFLPGSPKGSRAAPIDPEAQTAVTAALQV